MSRDVRTNRSKIAVRNAEVLDYVQDVSVGRDGRELVLLYANPLTISSSYSFVLLEAHGDE